MQDSSHADVGICGAQLLDESGHVSGSCARFATPLGSLFHAILLDCLSPRLGHFMAEWPLDTTRDVDQVIGAFLLVRRTVFDALGDSLLIDFTAFKRLPFCHEKAFSF